MNKQDLLDDILAQTDTLRASLSQSARSLQDFTRRLELILSQDHKNIAVRDTAFAADFSAFCPALRQDTELRLGYLPRGRGPPRGGGGE